MTGLCCARCAKRLSRKTARMIDGRTLCSTCMFASPIRYCPDCGKPRDRRGYAGPECQCGVKLEPGKTHSIKAFKTPV